MAISSRAIRLVFLVLILITISLVFSTCKEPPEPKVLDRPAMVVENLELRLRLAGVPAEFRIVANDGERLVIAPAETATEGQIAFANHPPEAGQNLPAEIKSHRAFVENQENGAYLGAQELVSQLGTTYYSRGRYSREGSETEETVIFTLHPYADRIMTITYRYPVGVDSSVRVQQLLDVLAVVEGLD